MMVFKPTLQHMKTIDQQKLGVTHKARYNPFLRHHHGQSTPEFVRHHSND